MAEAHFDVLGVGNAIVDVLAHADDAFIDTHGLAKGAMPLIDEDTAAPNFMIRDHRMQLLVAKDHEPITPFSDRVRALYEHLGVSTVLVVGGSGDYFDVAATVVAMDKYIPQEATARAQTIAAENPPPPTPLPPKLKITGLRK